MTKLGHRPIANASCNPPCVHGHHTVKTAGSSVCQMALETSLGSSCHSRWNRDRGAHPCTSVPELPVRQRWLAQCGDQARGRRRASNATSGGSGMVVNVEKSWNHCAIFCRQWRRRRSPMSHVWWYGARRDFPAPIGSRVARSASPFGHLVPIWIALHFILVHCASLAERVFFVAVHCASGLLLCWFPL